MADSLHNSSGRQTGYYCHVCKCRISGITESFTCPNCNSGFIEEVETSQEQDSSNNDLISFFSSGGGGDQPNENFFNILTDMNIFNQNVNSVNLGRFLSSVLSGTQANGGQFIRLLHGNPEDYVWSTDGLDSVITQLLNQIDNTGPPPMPMEEINKLNEISITDDHVNNKLQCPICMEDFILDEKVKELKCHHFFHNACIVEWLKLHSSCPTCRISTLETTDKTASTSSATSTTTTTTNSTSRPEATTSTATNQSTNSFNYNFNDDDLD